MIVISFGIEKSGSTLAFEMAKAVAELHGSRQALLPRELVKGHSEKSNIGGGWTDDELVSLVKATHGTRIVVKTHHPPYRLSTERILELCDQGDLKIHVVFRDPRDTLLSMLDHDRAHSRRTGAARELENLEAAITKLGTRLSGVREWGALPSLKLRYEEFAFDPTFGPTMIAEDLGLPTDPAAVWEIVGGRFTQKNVARPERYKTELSRDEIARIERAFPLYLDVVRGNPPAGWFARPGGTS